jgi:hypothetical protein
LNALYAHNIDCQNITSAVSGINHPYLNVDHIKGGTHECGTRGSIAFYLDRRMALEERPQQDEQVG